MMGTLATVLASQKIRTTQDLFQAKVTGDVEDIDGLLKITRINVHYDLRVAESKAANAQEAFASYLDHCPAAQSVIGSIKIEHDLTVENL